MPIGGNNLSNTAPQQQDICFVPLINWITAGYLLDVNNKIQDDNVIKWIPCPTCCSNKSFALKVEGQSMHDPNSTYSFKEGDLIFVDPLKKPSNNSIIVIKDRDTGAVLFKKLIIESGSKFLMSINPQWPERIKPLIGDLTLCGVVFFKGEEIIS